MEVCDGRSMVQSSPHRHLCPMCRSTRLSSARSYDVRHSPFPRPAGRRDPPLPTPFPRPDSAGREDSSPCRGRANSPPDSASVSALRLTPSPLSHVPPRRRALAGPTRALCSPRRRSPCSCPAPASAGPRAASTRSARSARPPRARAPATTHPSPPRPPSTAARVAASPPPAPRRQTPPRPPQPPRDRSHPGTTRPRCTAPARTQTGRIAAIFSRPRETTDERDSRSAAASSRLPAGIFRTVLPPLHRLWGRSSAPKRRGETTAAGHHCRVADLESASN